MAALLVVKLYPTSHITEKGSALRTNLLDYEKEKSEFAKLQGADWQEFLAITVQKSLPNLGRCQKKTCLS